MGEDPPAFDLLAWNARLDRMPATMHAETCATSTWATGSPPARRPRGGSAWTSAAIDVPAYVVGAEADHIAPWTSVYAGARLLGGDVRFVLSNSGHIAGVVARRRRGRGTAPADGPLPAEPGDWRRGVVPRPATWWTDWTRGSPRRAGELRDAVHGQRHASRCSRRRRVATSGRADLSPSTGDDGCMSTARDDLADGPRRACRRRRRAGPGRSTCSVDFIRAQRQLARLSLREMASMTSVSNAYLSQIERGLHQPSLKVLQSIADALQLSTEQAAQPGTAGRPCAAVRTKHGRAEHGGRDPGRSAADAGAAGRADRGLPQLRRRPACLT